MFLKSEGGEERERASRRLFFHIEFRDSLGGGGSGIILDTTVLQTDRIRGPVRFPGFEAENRIL